MRVLVTGATGDLGHRVVARLEKAGHEVLVGTRSPRTDNQFHYDLDDEEPPRLDGVDVVVHLASSSVDPSRDVGGSARLWEAARDTGVGHVIYVSIVGIDDHPYPYYRVKREVERQLETSDLPYTILRATQFHGLVPRYVEALAKRYGFVPLPAGIEVQPIDADVVADRIVELVQEGPSGRAADLGGPEVLSLDDMVADYMRARGDRRLRVRLPAWGDSVAAFRRGDHLAPHAVGGGATYADYLAGVSSRPAQRGATLFRVVAVALLATMAWMLISPATFHSLAAAFGMLNTHFVRDTATFILPLGVALWLAASRPAWRQPVLVLALLQNGAHIINHIADVNDTDPAWHGPVNLAALVVLEMVLWVLFSRELRVRRGSGNS